MKFALAFVPLRQQCLVDKRQRTWKYYTTTTYNTGK